MSDGIVEGLLTKRAFWSWLEMHFATNRDTRVPGRAQGDEGRGGISPRRSAKVMEIRPDILHPRFIDRMSEVPSGTGDHVEVDLPRVFRSTRVAGHVCSFTW